MKKEKQFLLVVTLIALFFIVSCGREGTYAQKEEKMLVISRVSPTSISINGSNDDWNTLGIKPLSGLRWVTVFSEPAKEASLRIRSISVTHDGQYLFLLFYLDPGIREQFETEGRTGSLGYIYLDIDGSESTGQRRSIADLYAGWDYRIYIPTGFAGGTTIGAIKPLVEYKIEMIKETIIEKVQYGHKCNSEYEDVPGGHKNTLKDGNYIAFKEKYLEIRVPLRILNIKVPTPIKMVIRDLSAFPDAETQIQLLLQ
ncbi:MAG: hypothetical protein AMJ78_07210 [Omnitrophica WOR_2 bacterium SM23_29]|nr:MAG: hypothetical protein AMJ78_07210 [Omnitrophica WOR_2 bacterium SM23_29]